MADLSPVKAIELRFAAAGYHALRRHLLADPDNERIAFVFCGRHQATDGRIVLLAREVAPVPKDALERQSAGQVTVTQAFSREVLQRARAQGLDLLDAHSHPFATRPAVFSAIDDQNEAMLARYVGARIPGMWYGAMVFSQEDVDARLWWGHPPTPVPLDRLTVIGSQIEVVRPRSARHHPGHSG
ncbi:MAG: Mov34/MPN/PAD-1 family protein, partial [Chloroflexota bacterium]